MAYHLRRKPDVFEPLAPIIPASNEGVSQTFQFSTEYLNK